MGVAAPTLAPVLHLTARPARGPAFSASVLGLLIGAILFGRLADRVGRKWVLTLSLAILGVFTLATALAWDFESLLVIRPDRRLRHRRRHAQPARARRPRPSAPGAALSMVTYVTAAFPFGGALAGAHRLRRGLARHPSSSAGCSLSGSPPSPRFAMPESQKFVEAKPERQAGNRHRAVCRRARSHDAAPVGRDLCGAPDALSPAQLAPDPE
jgi:hypothetical protein